MALSIRKVVDLPLGNLRYFAERFFFLDPFVTRL
jgi:hypothetical protein